MSLLGIDPRNPDEFKAHPPMPEPEVDDPEEYDIPVVRVLNSFMVGGSQGHHELTVLVPPPSYKGTTAIQVRHAVTTLLAEVAPMLEKALLAELEAAASSREAQYLSPQEANSGA